MRRGRPPGLASAIAVVLLITVLAGCLNAGDTEPSASQDGDPAAQLLDDGAVAVDVDVQVVLIGFDEGVADEVDERLNDEKITHVALTSGKIGLPDDPETYGTVIPPSVVPTARFVVHEAGPDVVDAYRHALDASVTDAGQTYDANAIEDWFADTLPVLGVPVDPGAPALVLVHGDPDGDWGSHAFRYKYANGWLEPVRVFGERHPVLVLDISAREDPWVHDTTESWDLETRAHDEPLGPGGESTVAAVVEATREAANYRLLQGPTFPVSTAPCHAVTLVVGVRSTSASEIAPGTPRAADLVDAERLRATLVNATRGDVRVDAVLLDLPLDDPGLDAVSRSNSHTLLLMGGLHMEGHGDVYREWMDANWERYWVEHAGCEAYVSFILFGDAADSRTSTGYAYYDVNADRRVSFSQITDLHRFEDRDASRGAYDYANMLLSHETGHLLGLAHPHAYLEPYDDPEWLWYPQFSLTFSSTWSTMGYQTLERTIDFGVADQTNFARNRAGHAVQQAVHAGHADASEVAEALRLMGGTDWEGAWRTVLPLIGDAGR